MNAGAQQRPLQPLQHFLKAQHCFCVVSAIASLCLGQSSSEGQRLADQLVFVLIPDKAEGTDHIADLMHVNINNCKQCSMVSGDSPGR